MISFEKHGWVSIWIGTSLWDEEDEDKDVLEHFCGVDYYDVDYQENVFMPDWSMVPARELLMKLSLSKSFIEDATKAAEKKGIYEARQVISQLNFKYDPKKVVRAIKDKLVFLGAFRWSM